MSFVWMKTDYGYYGEIKLSDVNYIQATVALDTVKRWREDPDRVTLIIYFPFVKSPRDSSFNMEYNFDSQENAMKFAEKFCGDMISAIRGEN